MIKHKLKYHLVKLNDLNCLSSTRDSYLQPLVLSDVLIFFNYKKSITEKLFFTNSFIVNLKKGIKIIK